MRRWIDEVQKYLKYFMPGVSWHFWLLLNCSMLCSDGFMMANLVFKASLNDMLPPMASRVLE